jgi:hypothetical protein
MVHKCNAVISNGVCITMVWCGMGWYIIDTWWEIVVNYENSLTVLSPAIISHVDWRVHTYN